MDHLPLVEFRACVERYRGDYRVQSFSCLDQFLTLAFAQLTHRDSLRDIETCLGVMQAKLYHMGFRCGTVRRTTLAHANDTRDSRIYQDFAHELIARARALYADEDLAHLGLDLGELTHTVYAFDATTIDLCLTLFPWARFHHGKAAVKLHTLLDLRGNELVRVRGREVGALVGVCDRIDRSWSRRLLGWHVWSPYLATPSRSRSLT